MKHIKNISHYVLGFAVAYAISNYSEFSTWDTFNRFMSVVCMVIITFGLGFTIEAIQAMVSKGADDFTDIVRTAIGGLIGGIIGVLFPNVSLISYVVNSISIVAIIYEIYILYKIVKK